MKATYYGVTTFNSQEGWFFVSGPAATREEAEQRANKTIGGIDQVKDIYQDTQYKNLRIVPKSKLAKYHLTEGLAFTDANREYFNESWDALAEEELQSGQ